MLTKIRAQELIIAVLSLIILALTSPSLAAEAPIELMDRLLGDGAKEIGLQVRDKMEKEADLVLYEVTPDEDRATFIIFLLVNDDHQRIDIYQVPLRNQVDIRAAEEIAQYINRGPIELYARANLLYFVDIIDIYDGVTIQTREGPIKMDSKRAREYMQIKEQAEDFERLKRQEEILLALEEKMFDSTNIFKFPRLVRELYTGLNRIESNITLWDGLQIGYYAVSYGLDQIQVY